MKLIHTFLLLALSSLTFTSCARQISSDTYTARQVGEVSATYMGVIRNIREVYIEQSDMLEHNQTGLAGGGITGGIIGNVAGRGNVLATAGGAIAGAVAGSLIEKRLKHQAALEYIVELTTGELMTVVQGKEPVLGIGQPVYILVSSTGRSRLIPQ